MGCHPPLSVSSPVLFFESATSYLIYADVRNVDMPPRHDIYRQPDWLLGGAGSSAV